MIRFASFVLLLVCTFSLHVYAQRYNNKDPFFDSQWWIGLKAGGNLSRFALLQAQGVYTLLTPDLQVSYQKDYDSFRHLGSQIGLTFAFNHASGLSVGLEPGLLSMQMSYRTQYAWQADNQALFVQYTHRVQLQYLETPLLLRYTPLYTTLRPTLLAGVFYGYLLQAIKYAQVESLDTASGSTNSVQNDTPVMGARELFIRSNWGFATGLAISYDIGNLRLALQAIYKHGMNNITHAGNRYTDNRLIGQGEAFDDLRTKNIEISFSCLFPMKFLETGSYRRLKY